MGTPEQKANRQAAAARQELIDQAKARGQIRSDTDLANFIQSIGGNPYGPQYKQNYSGGGYSLYGPSWDPGWNFDFENKQKIPWMGPGETWYDPSKPENWQKTPDLQDQRQRGFFEWRDKNMDMIDRDWGGNASAAWYALRARSNRPNSPDMSWWNEGNKGAVPMTAPSTPAAAPAPNIGKPITQSTPQPTQPLNQSIYSGQTSPIYQPRKPVQWNTTWRY